MSKEDEDPITKGLGVPPELLSGDDRYATSSLSLRASGGPRVEVTDPNPCEEIKVGMISMGCHVGEITSFDPTTKRSCEHIRELDGMKDGALVPGRTTGTISFLSASFVPAPRCERCSGKTDPLRDDIWTCPKCGQETGHTGMFPIRDAKETP